MGEYNSLSFFTDVEKKVGVRRYLGAGEGRDVKYDAVVKPSLGLYKSMEVVINETGPVPNLGAKGFDGTQPAIPAGATVTHAYIVTDGKVSANGVTINLVEKDGKTGSVALFEGVNLVPGATLEVAEGAAAVKRFEKAMYASASGLVKDLKAKLIIEYI